MDDKQFIETYCNNCGSQRCEGIGTEWFKGCKYRWNHDSYDATTKTERLNDKLMRKMAASTNGKISEEELAKLCYEDIWLEPEEALELGLIDEIIKER